METREDILVKLSVVCETDHMVRFLCHNSCDHWKDGHCGVFGELSKTNEGRDLRHDACHKGGRQISAVRRIV
jgi:hypothetical protein